MVVFFNVPDKLKDADAFATTVDCPQSQTQSNRNSPLEADRRNGHLSSTKLKKGQLIGKFVILKELGEGGMGLVYSAHDPDLDRKVALKLLRSTKRQNIEKARERLIREARTMAQLQHPNIVE